MIVEDELKNSQEFNPEIKTLFDQTIVYPRKRIIICLLGTIFFCLFIFVSSGFAGQSTGTKPVQGNSAIGIPKVGDTFSPASDYDVYSKSPSSIFGNWFNKKIGQAKKAKKFSVIQKKKISFYFRKSNLVANRT